MRFLTLLLTLLCAAPPADAGDGARYRVRRWVLDHLADARFTPALPADYGGL